MNENTGYVPRPWQAKAFKKIDRCLSSGGHETMAVNACVGSGKTDVAAYAFGKFISDNRGKKTVQLFVSPRIKLCKQQTDSVSEFVERRFGLKEGNGGDWKIVRVDSDSDEFNRKDPDMSADHVVFVVCDKSLWGISKVDANPERRWDGWTARFRKWRDEGRLFGAAFFDEAHNYEKNQDKMFGEEFHLS